MRTDTPAGLPERFERMADADVRLQVLSPAASPPYAEKEDDATRETHRGGRSLLPTDPVGSGFGGCRRGSWYR